MTVLTAEEMEQVELVIEFMARKVDSFQAALENDALPEDLKSNPEMYNDFVRGLSQFEETSSLIKENRLADLSEEQWKLINLLAIAVAGECQALGGPLKAIADSIAYTFLKILTPKWSERKIAVGINTKVSSDTDEITDMFNIIEEHDITPFLERNQQHNYLELYRQGKNKMLNNQENSLTREEKKVIFEASIYTIRYLKDLAHNISSLQKDLTKMNQYYDKYLKALKQDLY